MRLDIYEPDDRQAMVARYTELGGGLSALGDSPPERWLAEFALLFARQDSDNLLARISEEYELHDHRMIGWEPVRGRAQSAAMMESAWQGDDIRWEVSEVVAANDRVLAVVERIIGHGDRAAGGGEYAIDVGVVLVVEDGLMVRAEHFDPDDREGMLARFAELAAG
jgi:ketosteroid isomerase-like protein